jgi:hypothetical protein
MKASSTICSPGDLVRPSLNGLQQSKIIYLTPLGDPDMEDWPRWCPNEFAIVLSYNRVDNSYVVLTLDGIGICFIDEMEVVQQWK